MIKKIIYIGYQPLTEKVKTDFYFDNLIEHGFEVEYWDLTSIYFPGIFSNNFLSKYTVKFDRLNEVEDHLSNQEIGTTLFVIMVTYERRVLSLFRLLTKYKCYISFFARGMVPMQFLAHSLKSSLMKVYKAFNPKLLIAYLENKISFWQKIMGFVKPYDLIFNAGEFGIYTIGIGYEIEKKRSKIVELNSFDFDRYVTSLNKSKIVEGKYCVFLDEYLPFHPDFALFGIKTIDPINYYFSLNNFFKFIENKFNIKVVIAAHPKAEKYFTENPFETRKIFFNKTAELVKFAEFTLAHGSTSVSFSVLNNKPVVFLYNNCIKTMMADQYKSICFFSETLSAGLINMDKFSAEHIEINTIDTYKYNDYKYKFLTSRESEQKLSVDIYCDYISKL